MSARIKSFTMAALAIIVSGIPSFGIEGRIPIFAQTTITLPGSYIVTQDFPVLAGDGITISASPVTLDLNGHTITMPPGTGTGIRIQTGSLIVRIHNGRLIGGQIGVGGGGDSLIVVDRVEIDGPTYGINLVARAATVSSCAIRNVGITALGISGSSSAAPVAARVVDNVIVGSPNNSLTLSTCQSSEVGGNRITMSTNSGISVAACSGTRIHDNSVSLQPGVAGFTAGISLHGNGNQAVNNTVVGFATGIFVNQFHGNVVAGNVIQGGVPAGNFDAGIQVQGSRTLIEGNQVEGGGGCGLNFPGGAPATGNVYRDNMLRGNSLGGVCGAAAQTDAGGNVL